MTDYIIITGASSGIGKALAVLLAAQGKIIYAVARNEANLRLLKNEFPENIYIIVADIATETGRKKVKENIPEYVQNAYLINNAGMMAPSGYLENVDLTQWRYQIAVNAEAPLFLTQMLLPILKGGRVLNMSIYLTFL